MSEIGLYQTLKDINETKIKAQDKKNIIKNLKVLDDFQKEALILLIFEYAKNEDKINIENCIPYQINYENNDLTIDLNKLPNKLLCILLKFAEVVNQ